DVVGTIGGYAFGPDVVGTVSGYAFGPDVVGSIGSHLACAVLSPTSCHCACSDMISTIRCDRGRCGLAINYKCAGDFLCLCKELRLKP
ncbi:hypothetical protein, partial [Pseudomonas sp. GM48]|uniref:hypothetical protein n=1 Tax=Pseudomonas sp. GM48 TaxID=1144330 RepID=UPI00026FEE8A